MLISNARHNGARVISHRKNIPLAARYPIITIALPLLASASTADPSRDPLRQCDVAVTIRLQRRLPCSLSLDQLIKDETVDVSANLDP